MRTVLNYEAILASVPDHLQLSGFPAQPWADGLSIPWLASIILIHAGIVSVLATSRFTDVSDTIPPMVTMQVEMIAPAAPAPVRPVEAVPPHSEPPPEKAARPNRKPNPRPIALASRTPSPSPKAATDVTQTEPADDSPETQPTLEGNESHSASRPSREPAALTAPSEASQPRFDAGYLKNPAPTYPAAARRLGEEGRVVLRVLVEADGCPSEVAIKTSSGFPRLDQAAEDAVRRWKFVPARKGDEAVRAAVLVPIVFNLRD